MKEFEKVFRVGGRVSVVGCLGVAVVFDCVREGSMEALSRAWALAALRGMEGCRPQSFASQAQMGCARMEALCRQKAIPATALRGSDGLTAA